MQGKTYLPLGKSSLERENGPCGLQRAAGLPAISTECRRGVTSRHSISVIYILNTRGVPFYGNQV
jgi:hypothetical protein